ncbi:hypothetical protein N5D61_03425 [Pseudomonas sp. GD03842]|uniref:hypothetical protein n=1 Tax=Pseudomonas sp. GD03842 TaxID=2975385 RepID=UPI00244AA435|nr:hypothetical protein [Pseudomonas sp. GD03842]MDH0745396.1 hypothetical protein [Pseudomonas sp. GD03842]
MENNRRTRPFDATDLGPANRFQALVNGKPFQAQSLSGLACLQTELEGVRTRNIWKIHAVGKVGCRRTLFGLFLDRSLEPGTYDLLRNDRLTVIYHLTPKQSSQVYHSRDFQQGSLNLIECPGATGRLRGAFEFAIPAVGFAVTRGEFDVLCPPESARSGHQKPGNAIGCVL